MARSTSSKGECRASLPAVLFARLNAVCEDCYGLYKQPEIYSLCRYYYNAV